MWIAACRASKEAIDVSLTYRKQGNQHMPPAHKKTIAVDFDGVIHLYSQGWKDGTIYDTYVPGFFRWLLLVSQREDMEIVVHSSRFRTQLDIQAAREWIGKESIQAIVNGEVPVDTHWDAVFSILQFSLTKPPAWITIDDRAVTFIGDWDAPMYHPDNLAAFKTWQQLRRASPTAD
jgi:hypothetical protein